MALDAGELTLTLEYGHGLKDKDWFGKQDPYCIITVGNQTMRSKTAKDGGKNPVWNQQFRFNIINENNFTIKVMDEDVGGDDHIGDGIGQLAKVRGGSHTDRQDITLVSRKGGKARGHITVTLTFLPNKSLKPQATQAQPYGYPAAPYGAPAPYGAYPPAAYPPAPHGAPLPYGAPPATAAYGAPPAYGTPPPAAYSPAVGYPPAAQAPAAQPSLYGAPPAGHAPAGYPPAGYPPTGYPPAGYPPAGRSAA